MFANVISGMQGIVDHILVGNLVGYQANAAIGVSWQIIIVVIVFISSLFTGMAVLVARFAGANQPEKVNRVVYQAFLTAIGLSALMAAVGYFAAPALLHVVHAAPEVQSRILPEAGTGRPTSLDDNPVVRAAKARAATQRKEI